MKEVVISTYGIHYHRPGCIVTLGISPPDMGGYDNYHKIDVSELHRAKNAYDEYFKPCSICEAEKYAISLYKEIGSE